MTIEPTDLSLKGNFSAKAILSIPGPSITSVVIALGIIFLINPGPEPISITGFCVIFEAIFS